jgi:hypothetical protein
MEVIFAVGILATALLALDATVVGSIKSASTSINRRAAREVCRAKLEEILAKVTSPDGGGEIEDRPNFRWTARTDELEVGAPEGEKTETIKVVTVEVTFPVSSTQESAGGTTTDGREEGTESIKMASVLPPEEQQQGNGQ